jgi:hypothetical protein
MAVNYVDLIVKIRTLPIFSESASRLVWGRAPSPVQAERSSAIALALGGISSRA